MLRNARNVHAPRTAARITLVALAALLLGSSGQAGPVSATPVGLEAIHVPAGFKVEKVAGANLLSYPMLGTFDDRGRLFLCESSGNTLTTPEMAAKPDYIVRMLEDTDGDGVFDRSKVFADKLTLPAGAVWYRGSLYVAAPPDLIRFDDTDGDGVADHREVIVTGWHLSSNAASLHGPFLGPDGWLYLTDGRHGYNIKTKDGRTFDGQASRIWRVRPDGTGLEWVAGGGFDNPVELAFLPTGETFGTMTYFQDPRDGQRDAIMHWVWGGVYPKWYSVVSEFKRTGDLMPVMTKFARIAPAGLELYRGTSFGPQYQGNLFTAQFNPHRVQRHIVYREGATFRTEDSDFLTSVDPDFHPTDVIEDADGSLLVVDTGAWFIHGCPLSRVAKPEIKGSIYRVRRIGAPAVKDARGLQLKLADSSPADIAKHLDDARPAVRGRALEQLVEGGPESIAALTHEREHSISHETRSNAVWGLYRIGTPEALAAVRAALKDTNFRVRVAAAHALGMARDRDAVDLLLPVIYDELRKLAGNYLRRERPDHTLQPTALVHEAYIRLVDQTRVNWQNRAHFFGVAAQIMRRLLVDHARKHNAEKRGQDFQKLSLDENIDRAVERSAELIALDDALKALAAFDQQKARLVELRYFGGLSLEETADVMGVTPTTIKRHWRFAKAWLYGEMLKR